MPEIFIPADFFLHLDPLAAVGVPLATGTFSLELLPVLAVVASALLFGRWFCGYFCPFGITLDIVRWLLRRFAGQKRPLKAEEPLPGLRKIRYILLAMALGAAVVGVNIAHWGTPIPLITRFYALLGHAALSLGASLGLDSARPLLASLDMPELTFLQVAPRRYAGLLFPLVFFGLLFWLERVRPRFWCRYLCPAGALLALLSRKPVWRRRVSRCAHCGRCAAQCPTGAIAGGGERCIHEECITCRVCVDACPARAVGFLPGRADLATTGPEGMPDDPGQAGCGLPTRRALLAGAGAGVLLAAVQGSSPSSLLLSRELKPLLGEGCLRPPGTLPEPEFLARCLRCGLCMKACPTNGLQPALFEAGAGGMFTPVLKPRIGPCEPDCALCGRVCPTRAIVPLDLAEKRWAKIGTAVVRQERCLAFAENKSCVVCQEVCPYGAVDLVSVAGMDMPAPKVNVSRCFGCGYCELHCPVHVPAIVVLPLNALRLSGGFEAAGRSAGLDLRADGGHRQRSLPAGALPPGFTE